jgi:hypothetical protein
MCGRFQSGKINHYNKRQIFPVIGKIGCGNTAHTSTNGEQIIS